MKGNSPRQRTLREMQRLVAVAAAMGACAKGHDDSATKDGAPTAAKEPPRENIGYGVVDPMPPPPARCAGLAATVKTTVKWDGPFLEIALEAPSLQGASYDVKRKVVVSGAIVKKQTMTAKKVLLRLAPDPEVRIIDFEVPAICPEGPEIVAGRVAAPTTGGALRPGEELRFLLRDE